MRNALHRGPAPKALAAGQYWAMNFVQDQLMGGRRFRVLTVIDKWLRQCVSLRVDYPLTGLSVVDALNETALERPLPLAVTVDHGTEFTSKAFDEWSYLRRVKLDFIRPGNPTENGMIESFNARLRDERLNVNEFATPDDVRTVLTAWRHDYIACFSHGLLNDSTPEQIRHKVVRSRPRGFGLQFQIVRKMDQHRMPGNSRPPLLLEKGGRTPIGRNFGTLE